MNVQDIKRLNRLKKNNLHKLALKALELEKSLEKEWRIQIELKKSKDALAVKLDELEVAQMVFQGKLIAAVKIIEERKFWQKLFGYRKLVNRLISTIKKGFKKV
jgi:hypothetical protein